MSGVEWQAWRGLECTGKAGHGRHGAARQGLERAGRAWQARIGDEWIGAEG